MRFSGLRWYRNGLWEPISLGYGSHEIFYALFHPFSYYTLVPTLQRSHGEPWKRKRACSIVRDPMKVQRRVPLEELYDVATNFIEIIITYVADYLRDGRPSSVQGPDLENQNSLDSGEFASFVSCRVVRRIRRYTIYVRTYAYRSDTGRFSTNSK